LSLTGLLLVSGTLENSDRFQKIKWLAEKQKRDDSGALERDYSIRAPGDVVLSGPLTGSCRKGRMFSSRASALEWAKGKYGEEKVYELPGLGPEEEMRLWAVVVKNLRR
jgi:hypothetical protein